MSALLKSILLVISELFQLVFPLSEDEQTIKGLQRHQMLKKLRVENVNGVFVLSSFRDPEVRAALHLVKYHRHHQAIHLTAALVEAWVTAHITEPTIIVPIPLSAQRLRRRGYNQSEVILRAAITGLAHVTIRTDLLTRSRNTPPQTGLPRQARLKNLEGAFAVSARAAAIQGKAVILFDDVMTTGATFKAARAALAPLQPTSITTLAVAH